MAAMPIPQGGPAMVPPQLYAGSTTPSGMPVPAMPPQSGAVAGPSGTTGMPVSGPKSLPMGGNKYGGQIQTPGAMPVTSPGPASAPNGLTVNPNPGAPTPATPAPNYTSKPGNAEGSGSVLGENQNYYGTGMGALLTNYLESGAGYNGPLAQQTITATDNAMQQQINQQYGGLQTALAEAGPSPYLCASALGQSNLLSTASADENQVAAQQYTEMYSQSQSLYQNTLMQMANVNAQGTQNQTTVLGSIGAALTGNYGYFTGNAGEVGAPYQL